MAFKVLVGPDGVIKLIDVNTGKEVPADKIITHQRVTLPGDTKPRVIGGGRIDPKELEELLDKALQNDKAALENLHRALEKLHEIEAGKDAPKKPDAAKNPGITKPIEIEIELKKGDDKPRIIIVDKKKIVEPGPMSVDRKLDLILKQLDELRRDVDGIKKRLDGKPADRIGVWQVVPGGKDAKPGTDALPRIQVLPLDGDKKKIIIQRIRGLPGGDAGKDIKDAVRKRLEDAIKKLEVNRLRAVPPAGGADLKRVEELERALEAVRRQLEEARQELKKKDTR